MPRSPSSRRWIRVLCQAATRDPVLCAKLLRRVWQRRRNDVGGRDAHVLLPNPQTKWEEGKVLLSRHERHPTNDPATEKRENIKKPLLLHPHAPTSPVFEKYIFFLKKVFFEKYIFFAPKIYKYHKPASLSTLPFPILFYFFLPLIILFCLAGRTRVVFEKTILFRKTGSAGNPGLSLLPLFFSAQPSTYFVFFVSPIVTRHQFTRYILKKYTLDFTILLQFCSKFFKSKRLKIICRKSLLKFFDKVFEKFKITYFRRFSSVNKVQYKQAIFHETYKLCQKWKYS